MNNPERDPWPSVDDKNDELACDYCEAMPHERHQPSCPLYAPVFDDLQWCDGCGRTTCACDRWEDDRE